MLKKIIFKLIIAVYVGVAIFRLTDPALKWSNVNPNPVQDISSAPTDIKIPKLNLDLAISPSIIKDGNWQVFDDRVAWLSTSALPGKGNSILYAHDRAGLFGDLYKLKKGDEIQIYNGKWISYKITQIHKVNPTDINSVLSEKNQLTLFTCSGAFDQKRLVVYAE